MNQCCVDVCQDILEKGMKYYKATEAIALQQMLQLNIKRLLPKLNNLLGNVWYRVINSKKFHGAQVIPKNCPNCKNNNAVIFYSSQAMLLVWELQALFLQQITQWEDHNGKTTVKFRQPNQNDYARYLKIKNYYIYNQKDSVTDIFEIVNSFEKTKQSISNIFIDNIILGELWIILHEIGHYIFHAIDTHDIFNMIDVQELTNLRKMAWNFAQSIKTPSEDLKKHIAEYESDLFAAHLLLTLNGEVELNVVHRHQFDYYAHFWRISGAIGAAFPVLELIETKSKDERKYPYLAQRIYLILTFLERIYPYPNKTDVFSLVQMVGEISKSFSQFEYEEKTRHL